MTNEISETLNSNTKTEKFHFQDHKSSLYKSSQIYDDLVLNYPRNYRP